MQMQLIKFDLPFGSLSSASLQGANNYYEGGVHLDHTTCPNISDQNKVTHANSIQNHTLHHLSVLHG